MQEKQTERVVHSINKRDGIYYAPNENIPFTGKLLNFHPNGQKFWEINFINGKENGLSTEWYENGQKHSEINFINGKENGLFTDWYENGQKNAEVNIVDGKEIDSDKFQTQIILALICGRKYVAQIDDGASDAATVAWALSLQCNKEYDSLVQVGIGTIGISVKSTQQTLRDRYTTKEKKIEFFLPTVMQYRQTTKAKSGKLSR